MKKRAIEVSAADPNSRVVLAGGTQGVWVTLIDGTDCTEVFLDAPAVEELVAALREVLDNPAL